MPTCVCCKLFRVVHESISNTHTHTYVYTHTHTHTYTHTHTHTHIHTHTHTHCEDLLSPCLSPSYCSRCVCEVFLKTQLCLFIHTGAREVLKESDALFNHM